MKHHDYNPYAASMTNREIMGRLLRQQQPDIDINDDEAVFGLIIDDYADYARLLADEMHEGHPLPDAEIDSDGLPHLN